MCNFYLESSNQELSQSCRDLACASSGQWVKLDSGATSRCFGMAELQVRARPCSFRAWRASHAVCLLPSPLHISSSFPLLPSPSLAFPRLPVTLLSPPWIQGDKLRSEDLCVPRCLAAILSLAPRQAGTRPRWHRASTWWDWWPVSEA